MGDRDSRVLKTTEVRYFLFVKAIELKQDSPDLCLIKGLERRIEAYKRSAGIKRYLSEMLANWSKRSPQDFRFFSTDNRELFFEGRFLLDTLAQESLPFKIIEIETGTEKYL